MMCFAGGVIAIFCTLIISCSAEADTTRPSYIYSADARCLEEPQEPQYGGGLLEGSKFDLGLDGWEVKGNATIIIKKSTSNNSYLVAYDRNDSTAGFSRKIDIQQDYIYTFSAWFQVSEDEDTIVAYRDIDGEDLVIGTVIAKAGCWSMLKGGFTSDSNATTEIFFKSPNTALEVWIDSVSLKEFTKQQWRDDQNKTINKIRKREIIINVVNEQGEKLEGANITLTRTRPLFTIGGGVVAGILDSPAYQDYFTARFTAANPHNELKWYFTEVEKGDENYTVPDAMVSFFKQHHIAVRGHCVLWDSVNATQSWVRALPPREVLNAALRRAASFVSRYAGDLLAWDVVNENLHNSYFESVLGVNASSMFYQIVRAIDPHTPLFLNEYNTLEYPKDLKVIPARYVRKLREIRAFPGNENLDLRFGLQAHFFSRPNVSFIRSAFDYIGSTGRPIWLTELDINRNPNQAEQLEDVMREAFAHPAMEGMIVWGWRPSACTEQCLNVKDYRIIPKGCAQMCLVDSNFNSLPCGDTVDKLLNEWKSDVSEAPTDGQGTFSQRLFHGDYNVTLSHPSFPNPLQTNFSLIKEEGPFNLTLTLK